MSITSVVVGIFVDVICWPLSEYSVYVMLIAGIIARLTASGTFDLLKAAKKRCTVMTYVIEYRSGEMNPDTFRLSGIDGS